MKCMKGPGLNHFFFFLIVLAFLFIEVAKLLLFDRADDNIWTYLVKRIDNMTIDILC